MHWFPFQWFLSIWYLKNRIPPVSFSATDVSAGNIHEATTCSDVRAVCEYRMAGKRA